MKLNDAFEVYRKHQFGTGTWPTEALIYFGAGWKACEAENERLRAAYNDTVRAMSLDRNE